MDLLGMPLPKERSTKAQNHDPRIAKIVQIQG
jgi:hypothetical protein